MADEPIEQGEGDPLAGNVVLRMLERLPRYGRIPRDHIPRLGSEPGEVETVDPGPLPAAGLQVTILKVPRPARPATRSDDERVVRLERQVATLERAAARERMRRLRVEREADGATREHRWREPHTPPPEGYAWCPECRDSRPLAEFNHDSTRPSGVAGYCRVHQAAASKRSRTHLAALASAGARSALRRSYPQAEEGEQMRGIPLSQEVGDLEELLLRHRTALRVTWEYAQFLDHMPSPADTDAWPLAHEQAQAQYHDVKAQVARVMPELTGGDPQCE